jgi:hypothetical protein|tara:strand:- start:599 stop:793 length:195 start_codon:yes stop_codon:yes gene_type:complete
LDLIILHDDLYHLIEVTKEMVDGEVFKSCFDLCDIMREKLTVYHNNINKYLLKDGSVFFGCVCN